MKSVSDKEIADIILKLWINRVSSKDISKALSLPYYLVASTTRQFKADPHLLQRSPKAVVVDLLASLEVKAMEAKSTHEFKHMYIGTKET